MGTTLINSACVESLKLFFEYTSGPMLINYGSNRKSKLDSTCMSLLLFVMNFGCAFLNRKIPRV